MKRFAPIVCLMVAALSASVACAQAPTLEFEAVAEGLSRPLYVTHDGSERLFIVEQGGRILMMEDGETSTFLDISALVSQEALGNGYTERGLLGLAFSPTYADDRAFYVNYTNTVGESVVARYRTAAIGLADPTSEEILLTVGQPFANHNGGHMDFGPDGYLYISLGDGGSRGDPQANGQNANTLLGTLLRIDVSVGTIGYGVPEDNPFVGTDAGADEVWAYGLRNVWRFSFDNATGDLYFGDVGQNRWEEINYEPAGSPGGLNYGWNVFEANNPYSGAAPIADAIAPIATYQHTGGNCSVTGGYVYRGAAVPSLVGQYLYGDYCSGQLWSAQQTADGAWSAELLMDTNFTISSFGQDANGELYVIDYNRGSVFRIVAGA